MELLHPIVLMIQLLCMLKIETEFWIRCTKKKKNPMSKGKVFTKKTLHISSDKTSTLGNFLLWGFNFQFILTFFIMSLIMSYFWIYTRQLYCSSISLIYGEYIQCRTLNHSDFTECLVLQTLQINIPPILLYFKTIQSLVLRFVWKPQGPHPFYLIKL